MEINLLIVVLKLTKPSKLRNAIDEKVNRWTLFGKEKIGNF